MIGQLLIVLVIATGALGLINLFVIEARLTRLEANQTRLQALLGVTLAPPSRPPVLLPPARAIRSEARSRRRLRQELRASIVTRAR